MKLKKMKWTVTICALFLTFVLVQPATAEKVLRVGVRDTVGTLDPAFWMNSTEALIMSAVHPKLINYVPGDKWVYENELAESIDQVDATTIKFTLKKGGKWSNGYGDITAEDVKFSYERYNRLDAPNKGDWANLKEVQVTGKYSGVIKLTKPFAPLFTSTLPYTSGMVTSKKAALEQGDKKMGVEINGFGGAYKIEEFVPKQRLVVVRNEGWVGQKPVYDKIIFVQLAGDKAAENALLSGEIDYAEIPVTSKQALQGKLAGKGEIHAFSTDRYLWVGLNMENSILKDPRIRKAIKKAIDVPTAVDAGYMGAATIATGMISPSMIGHLKTRSERDVAGARELLAEAGVKNLALELDIQARPYLVTIAQVIQANLAEAGIKLQINQHDSGTFWSLASEKKENLQMTLKGYTQPPDPMWGTQWFISEQAGVWNWEWFKNEEFDKLHFDAMSSEDTKERAEMYTKMMLLMNESDAFVWLAYEPRAIMFSNKIKPTFLPDNSTITRWDLFK